MVSGAQSLKYGSALLVFCAASALASCEEQMLDCVAVSSDCAPLYEPTFDNIHQRTLVPSCAIGSSCHSSEGAKAGLVFDTADESYKAILGLDDPGSAFIPDDPGCSLIVKRIESIENPMPPGQRLSEAERCVIVQWIAQGAPR